MKLVNLNKVEFVKSAASERQFISSSLPSVVFAGKSNVGKSSVINSLLNRKNFARVGSEPGKTVHINYFMVDERMYLIDLPGYGYAKVSQSERDRWAALMEQFFRSGLFSLGVMIVDSRHKPTSDDVTMAEYFKNCGRPFIILANKTDKLKKSEIGPNLEQIRLALDAGDVPVIPYSAEKGTGKDLLLSAIFNTL